MSIDTGTMRIRLHEDTAGESFREVWRQWDLSDGQLLEDESLYKFGPSTYVTESLYGGPGALVWAVNDYWALTCVNSEDRGRDDDRQTWIPPGLCGLPDGYRQREVHEAAQGIKGKRLLSVNAVYNFGTGEFEFTKIYATLDITVFYDTRDTDADIGPVFITYAPQRIGPLEDNLTTGPR